MLTVFARGVPSESDSGHTVNGAGYRGFAVPFRRHCHTQSVHREPAVRGVVPQTEMEFCVKDGFTLVVTGARKECSLEQKKD